MTVELKNDLAITGVLHSVDQYLNVKLNNVKVVNETKYPHMVRSEIYVYICCLEKRVPLSSSLSSRLPASPDLPICLSAAELITAACCAAVCQKLLHQRVCRSICSGAHHAQAAGADAGLPFLRRLRQLS